MIFVATVAVGCKEATQKITTVNARDVAANCDRANYVRRIVPMEHCDCETDMSTEWTQDLNFESGGSHRRDGEKKTQQSDNRHKNAQYNSYQLLLY